MLRKIILAWLRPKRNLYQQLDRSLKYGYRAVNWEGW